MAGVKGKSGGARPNAGGARHGAGRPKKEPVLINAAGDSDPKGFLLAVMGNLMIDVRLRIDAAKALLPFMHAKRGELGKKEGAADAAQQAGRGKFAPSTPPKLASITRLPAPDAGISQRVKAHEMKRGAGFVDVEIGEQQ